MLSSVEISAHQLQRRPIRLGGGESLEAHVVYDEVREKAKTLPLAMELCGAGDLRAARVVSVNDQRLASPLSVQLTSDQTVEGCRHGRGSVNLKKLGEHFTRGLNRFELQVGEQVAEIVLDIEL
ncbi:MAG: hypothetical protein AAF533_29155 [Acidobacteriota bacterium]